MSETLEEIRKLKKAYSPSEETKARNHGKHVIMMVGPSGTGKSVLTDEVMRLHPDFQPIATRTTRPRRPGDPKTFTTANEGFTHEASLDLIQKRMLINFSIFGTNIYGTTPEDFPLYSIGPITADSVPALLDGGFSNAVAAFPIVSSETFKNVLEAERMSFGDISARLEEGIESVDFALTSVGEPWFLPVNNSHELGGLEQAAHKVIAFSEGHGEQMATPLAKQALNSMREVLVSLQSKVNN
ncbi:MAG: hypothetical protein WAR37_04180 [Candidatus Microsaccharimonas sp.]